jgi:glycine betaine/proline transport system permease protein
VATTLLPTKPPAAAMLARRANRWAIAAGVAFVVIVLVWLTGGTRYGAQVPTWLDAHVKPATDRLYRWVVLNNQKSWIFTYIFDPISAILKAAYTFLHWVLVTLRWPGVLALTAAIGYRTGGPRAAIVGVASLVGCSILGLWDDTMVSMALMIVSVAVSLLVGVPLGIWAGLNDRADRILRLILDTAQVMPAYVYLLPVVVLFGIGNSGAVVATVIFALAPAVRLTSLGIRSVELGATEVGQSFGCTRRQLLTKVQLPIARRAILLGLNQVIMMAFGILVIAALVGAGGLGQKILAGLQRVDVGKTFTPGLAMVLAAIALDRITTGDRRKTTRARWLTDRLPASLQGRRLQILVGVVAAGIVFLLVPNVRIDLSKPVNSFVKWLNNNIRRDVPIIGGTQAINDFLILKVLTPLRDLLQYIAWWMVALLAGALGWKTAGRKLGLICASCMVGIAALRTWDLAMDTLSQVLVSVVIAVALAVPIGILAGRSDRFERVIRPILDAAQVMPSFVYMVPVMFLFDVGRVPGVIASVIYALPPGIRLTSHGLRQVSASVREAAVSFGATPRQELVKVQLPLALRSVMLGINQTILMTLSMVIVAALIGAGGLGLETVYGLTKKEIGRGLAGGASIVLLAVVLDRLTQAWGTNTSRPKNNAA